MRAAVRMFLNVSQGRAMGDGADRRRGTMAGGGVGVDGWLGEGVTGPLKSLGGVVVSSGVGEGVGRLILIPWLPSRWDMVNSRISGTIDSGEIAGNGVVGRDVEIGTNGEGGRGEMESPLIVGVAGSRVGNGMGWWTN